MSRTGVEAKPPWSAVPTVVRRAVEEIAGAPVTRGARIWGGYGPAPTFRLRLADGRGVFFKGVHGASNEFSRRALTDEARVYRELGALISPWAPHLYGEIAVAGWQALLLEDLGPKSAPPWTPALAREAARDFAAFHAHTLGRDLPGWLANFAADAASVTWELVEEETERFRLIAEMAHGQRAEAHAWLRAALPDLARVTSAVGAIPGPYALIHGDVRSDNLRLVNGRLRLFDWPFAQRGFAEFDLAEFAQSVTVDGGPEPEQMVAWYAERLAVREDALDASIGWLAAFFAHFAWQPDIPELPRLRRFQRQQLAVTLRWATRRLSLPAPDWTAALD